MYIFIDEAGAFQIPPRPNAVSCVAALVVPESLATTLFRKFRRVTKPWKVGGREVKGSQLLEAQMAEVIRTIRRLDILLIATVIDMGIHTGQGISSHKEEQAVKILASVTPAMASTVRARLEGLAARVRSLSDQLYVQSVLLTTLMHSVLAASTLYYSQRIPKALGRFCWRLDAKDVTPTRHEQLWQDIVGPLLQTQSLSTPLACMKGADYSAFQRYMGQRAEPPEHLRERVSGPDGPFTYVDIDALLSDMKFCASHRVTGIQMVDVLASVIRRACNNTLQSAGWKGLGRLMPRQERGKNCVRLLALEDVNDVRLPYAGVIDSWDRETKRMIV